ncbi:MAG TPA: PaaI family thioesterase [Candidatus Dormibacteraeota bacterium]|nr:PaaI family thioesterase [Candidatus Dormibacteraeota bacterium]
MSENFLEMINSAPNGWVKEMGLHLTEATPDRVVATIEISERHHQGYGIVHGGVYCGIIETLASVGAHLFASREGRAVAGLENHTSFVRAIRGGRLTATATPITRGRRSHLWQCDIVDEEGRMIATGRVRLHSFEPGEEIAGQRPRMERG